MNDGLVYLDRRLTVHEQFRLLEIAHETGHGEIRDMALRLLLDSRSPQMLVAKAANG